MLHSLGDSILYSNAELKNLLPTSDTAQIMKSSHLECVVARHIPSEQQNAYALEWDQYHFFKLSHKNKSKTGCPLHIKKMKCDEIVHAVQEQKKIGATSHETARKQPVLFSRPRTTPNIVFSSSYIDLK